MVKELGVTDKMKLRKDPDHWTEQPRGKGGKFSTDSEPTHKSIIGFKLPVSLYEYLDAIAQEQGKSVNLVAKEKLMTLLQNELETKADGPA